MQQIVRQVREASGLPVGLYCHGAAGRALSVALEGARGGATPIASAIYPIAITLYRPSAEVLVESLAGTHGGTGVDLKTLWEACELVDAELGDMPVPPLTPGTRSALPSIGFRRRSSRASTTACGRTASPIASTTCSTSSAAFEASAAGHHSDRRSAT